jgi:rhomboid family GlyGly-CTERM serine protease
LNGAGLLLVWFLVGEFLRARQWLVVTLISILGMDIGFWFLQPQLQWYVGLSGLLHGFLFAGIVAGCRKRKVEMAVLGIIVVGKLVYEALVGPLPGSELTSGGAVITAAHLYGAISGFMASTIMSIRVLWQPSI